MPPARHAVGDDSGKQRFDRAEQREGDRVGQDCLDLCEGHIGQGRRRQRARNAAELAADRRHVEAEAGGDERAEDDGEQHAGPAGPEPARCDDDGDREAGDEDRLRLERGEAFRQRLELGDERAGLRPR